MMCSIFGAFGRLVDEKKFLRPIQEHAKDRGRDGGRIERFDLGDEYYAFLGNWRATPTPELEKSKLQPYDGLVHNGTIANDKELGVKPGEIDTMVLPRILDRNHGVDAFVESLRRIKGSYAIACTGKGTVFLANNYKPIHYWSPYGEAIYFSSMARHFEEILPFGQAPVQLPPYTVMDLRTRIVREIERKDAKRAVIIASAGLDSTCVATKFVRDGWDVCLLHFKYGCTAQTREAALIPKIAERLGCTYHFLTVDYSEMKGNSPILSKGSKIADGIAGAEFAHEWVPARNFLMLAHATAFAEANGYHCIALGNNLEESGAYPDNEEQMTVLLDNVLNYAVSDGYNLRIVAPVGNLMKHEIVKLGLELDAPFDVTWSCYRDEEKHCGECGPCFMRKTAFERNGTVDPVFAQ